MLHIVENFLTVDELKFLTNFCNNIEKIDQLPSKDINGANYYHRCQIHDENFTAPFISKLEFFLLKKFNIPYYCKKLLNINKITSETNDNGKFHYDSSDLTIVVYLNEGFIGGEYVYIDGNDVNEITPKLNMSLIMNNKCPHKVKKVTEGVRYSLVCFFEMGENKNKNLI